MAIFSQITPGRPKAQWKHWLFGVNQLKIGDMDRISGVAPVQSIIVKDCDLVSGIAPPIHRCRATHTPVSHHPYTGVASPIHQCRITHTPVSRHPYTGAAPLIHGCRVTHTPVSQHPYTGIAAPVHQNRLPATPPPRLRTPACRSRRASPPDNRAFRACSRSRVMRQKRR